jgi:hypothetical protein
MKGKKVVGALTVDCANGVGGPKLAELLKYLPKASQGGVDIKILNDDVLKAEVLNHEVGQPSLITFPANTLSVEQISSRPSSELPQPPEQPSTNVAAHTMVMQTESFTTSPTLSMVSAFLMGTRLLL